MIGLVLYQIHWIADLFVSLEEYIYQRRNGYIALLADRVPVNCTPEQRSVPLIVKPSHWNVMSRRCTSPLCSICFAAKLTHCSLRLQFIYSSKVSLLMGKVIQLHCCKQLTELFSDWLFGTNLEWQILPCFNEKVWLHSSKEVTEVFETRSLH